MIIISDSCTVPVPTSDVWKFLTSMSHADYLRWHPADHIDLSVTHEVATEGRIGRRVVFRERIGARRLSLRCRVHAAKPNKYVEYRPTGLAGAFRLGRGSFELTAEGDGTKMRAIVELGWQFPVFGWLADKLIIKIIDISALKNHIADEGRNMADAVKAFEGS